MPAKITDKLGIKRGEGTRTALMFSYIFLVIASLLIIKPVRNSLFLTKFGPEQLPYVYILAAVVSAAVAAGYAHLSNRIAFKNLITISLIIFTFCFLTVWLLLFIGYQADWFV